MQSARGKFETTDYCYENGILDYVTETDARTSRFTMPQFWEAERKGRDREDKPEYKVKIIGGALLFQPASAAWSITTTPPGWNTAARRKRLSSNAFVYAIDAYLKAERQIYKDRVARSRSRMWQTALCW